MNFTILSPRFLTVIVATLYCLFAFGSPILAKRSSSLPISGDGALLFTENRGQLADDKGSLLPEILFSMQSNGAAVFLYADGISYQFRTHSNSQAYEGRRLFPHKDKGPDTVRTHRFTVRLEGANLTPPVIHDAPTGYTENFYLPQCPLGVLGVPTYNRLTYKNVYPGIDWVVYSLDGRLKYDFIVHAGANPSLIRLRVSDAEKVMITQDGSLRMTTSLGEVSEQPPVSFSGQEKIPTSFRINADGTIGFTVASSYNRSKPLIIDPAVEWGTYYGSYTGNELGYACATDSAGNVFMAGHTEGTTNIATPGAFQTVLNSPGSSGDAFIVKFNANGTRLWGTYFGGGLSEDARACTVDKKGSVYITGTTSSTNVIGYNGFQNAFGGGSDAFLAKFNASGARIWSTYYGSYGFAPGESGNGCAVDDSNNVYMAGSITSNGMALNGYKNTYSGGPVYGDAFLVKFDSSGNRKWATYYGGTADELGADCIVDTARNVILTGFTSSSTGIAFGGFQNSIAGGQDAFIAKFNSNGGLIWGTYYGGPAADEGVSCSTTRQGDIYIAGTTGDFSTSGSLTGIATPGAQQSSYGGGTRDAFLIKFNAAGTRLWGTYFGGNSYDIVEDCATDKNGNVYITGRANSSNNIAANGFQNVRIAGQGYIARFDTGGTRTWGSYYGGNGLEWPFGCATYGNNIVYLAGQASSDSGIFYKGFQSARTTCFLAKIDHNPLTNGPLSGTQYCSGDSVIVPFLAAGDTLTFGAGNTFIAQLSDATGQFGTPVTIGSLGSRSSGSIHGQIPPATLAGSGYRIRVLSTVPSLIAVDGGNSLTINERVLPVVSIAANPDTVISAGQLVSLTATVVNGGSNPQFQWFKNGVLIPGATTNSYSLANLLDGDQIGARLKSNAVCAYPDTALSNKLNFHLLPNAVRGIRSANGVSVYPNPASGSFFLSGNKAIGSQQLVIKAITGQIMLQSVLPASSVQWKQEIILPAGMASGIYIVQLTAVDGQRNFLLEVK